MMLPDDGTYHCVVPTYRSTGDVSVKDDVLGDIARVYCYENFEMKPLPVNFEHAVRQPKEQLDRKIREYWHSAAVSTRFHLSLD